MNGLKINFETKKATFKVQGIWCYAFCMVDFESSACSILETTFHGFGEFKPLNYEVPAEAALIENLRASLAEICDNNNWKLLNKMAKAAK